MALSDRAGKILIFVLGLTLFSLLGGWLFLSSYPSEASFGTQEYGSLTGYVFNDLNANSTRDGGEQNKDGVQVSISGPSGNLSTFTNLNAAPNNNYTFSNLIPGDYTVTLSVPAGWRVTTTTSVSLTIGPGVTRTANFGIQQLASISGYVWSDLNGNAVRDGSSPNKSGVTVSFSGPSVVPNQTTSGTAAPGNNYTVSNLIPGTYNVTVTVPAGWRNTTPLTVTLTLGSGGSGSANFGVQQYANLSGYVWNDLNGNGVRDGSSPNRSNITVSLTAGPSSPRNTTTDSTLSPGNNYSFSNLIPGTYTVNVSVPANWYATTPATVSLTISPGGAANVNFGIQEGAALSGYVWSDLNGNAVRDGSSPNKSGVTVSFSGPSTIPNQVTNSTAAPGNNYTVTNVQPGSYDITVTVPAGWRDTTATTVRVTLAAGETRGANFGVQEYGSLSGYVWEDLDGNGARDGASPNKSGVTVSFSGPATIPNQITNNNASPANNYTVSGIIPGSYTVTVTVPGGWLNTTSTSVTVSLSAGGTVGANFGLQQYGSLVGYVWSDLNGNGTRDGSSPNKSGVTVSFSGPSAIPNQTTNGNAAPADNYGVFNILPGTYNVTVSVPSGWRSTTPTTVSVTLGSGGTGRANFGLQEYGSLSLRIFDDNGQGGGTAENGLNEALEPLDGSSYSNGKVRTLSGVETASFSGATTTVNNVVPGNYKVEITVNDRWRVSKWSLDAPGSPVSYTPGDYSLVSGSTYDTGSTLVVTVSPGANTGVDLGLRSLGIVQGRFFIDNGGTTGRYDPAVDTLVTPPFTNPSVSYTSNHPSAGSATVSDANLGDGCGGGSVGYRAENLTPTSPGSYSYTFVYDFTAPNYLVTGAYFTNGAADCQGTYFADGSGSGSSVYTVTGIQLNRLQTANLWVGIRQAGRISGYVWDDYYYYTEAEPAGDPILNQSRNTSFDTAIEQKLENNPNFRVQVRTQSGQVVGQMYPGVSGRYEFNNLSPGNYTVELEPQVGYCRGGSPHGETGWSDKNNVKRSYTSAAPPLLKTGLVELSSGEEEVVNFGTVTDYDLEISPSNAQQLNPGESVTYTILVEPDPTNCWVGGNVNLSVVPDDNWATLGLSGNFTNNTVDPNHSTTTLTITAGSGTPEGNYGFQVSGESPSPGRRRSVRISVVVQREHWLQLVDGDLYVGHASPPAPPTEIGIDFILPDIVLGGFRDWFLAASTAKRGGMVLNHTGEPVLQAVTGADKTSERLWKLQDYPSAAALQLPVLNTSLLSSAPEVSDWSALIPGSYYKATSLPATGTYDLTGPGVALVYFGNNLSLDRNFVQANPAEERERVILVINGTLTVSSAVITDPPAATARANIEAALMVYGEDGDGDSIILEDSSGNGQLKVKGMVYAVGGIVFNRDLDNNRYPSLVINFDPLYLTSPVAIFTSSIFSWKESQP